LFSEAIKFFFFFLISYVSFIGFTYAYRCLDFFFCLFGEVVKVFSQNALLLYCALNVNCNWCWCYGRI